MKLSKRKAVFLTKETAQNEDLQSNTKLRRYLRADQILF